MNTQPNDKNMTEYATPKPTTKTIGLHHCLWCDTLLHYCTLPFSTGAWLHVSTGKRQCAKH